MERQKGHTTDQWHPGPPHDHSKINFALQKTLLLPLTPQLGKLRYVDKTASVAAVSQEQSFDIRTATPEDWPGMWSILQPVIREGETFTWDRDTTEQAARTKWMKEAPGQTFVAVRQDTGEILGTGEFHANQAGGGSHVANAGYMVGANNSGQGIARALCAYSLSEAKAAGFRSMQYNAVVESNVRAVWLWQSMGFKILATVPEAFNHPEIGYVGLHVMYRKL
ncbi:GNAT family N-acetyltransferase [Arthrobacter sp. MYb51]|uniref:GNAT family N-acetyltransferase n=1 Tax=Arthrobacter sp. MYb51 TaxID=1848604 RepID=UPI00215893B7|nr:GNAT family N-acetyltransferase [Arthrobacter sp. MYb51]